MEERAEAEQQAHDEKRGPQQEQDAAAHGSALEEGARLANEDVESSAPPGSSSAIDGEGANGDGNKEEEKGGEERSEEAAKGEEEGWLYVDDGGVERGPYSLQEMLTWWNCQLLRPDLQVRRCSETRHTDLSARPEFNPHYYYAQYYYAQQQQQQQPEGGVTHVGTGASTASTEAATPAPEVASSYGYAYGEASAAPQQSNPDRELAARLMAESYTQVGTFNARTGKFQVQKRGWDDPAGRQIAHYFDEQAWQQQVQHRKPKKIKLSKKEIQKYKERKKKKKIPDYLLGD